MAAEAEAVAHPDLDLDLARLVRHVVEVAVGSGFSRLIVGGTMPVLMVWIVAIASTAAGAHEVPVIDFVLLIGTRYASSPKSVLIAVSDRSFGGVEVPWALM